MRAFRVTFAAMTLIVLLASPAAAQFAGWQHSGSIYILTTPEGVDLPATAVIENFPVLVRLHKDSFDFRQAKADGADLRFATSDGTKLAYQIDEWDAARGEASVWVRVPKITGNSRQEIKLHWGKADAVSESNGAAVFNESNGYLSVLHLSDPVRDEVGTVKPTDDGTTASAGMIGPARRFSVGKGINCGETIATFPIGASDHSSEAWFRAEVPNALAMAWGNEHGQGKITMRIASPPHVQMECYFSGADIRNGGKVTLGQWTQVVHTYRKGESRVYVNGVLDGTNMTANAPLAIKSPARMYVGGWYRDYRFVGDIDEVRVSNVVRSAVWVKLQYENQKPLQTAVGSLVQPGQEFAVSTAAIKLDENQSVTVAAKAGGAQKIYWILKRGGTESVVASDRNAYTLDAGRVVADTSAVLQFKAVYADQVKTRDIPVTVKETIPEPVFTLQAPAKWNGRDAIELVPTISNRAAMKASGAGDLHYQWSVAGGAVLKAIAPDRLILKRSQCSGLITVQALINNGGTDSVATASIQVTEPKSDPWMQRTLAKDEQPVDGQFYARDDQNEGTLYYNGTLTEAADAVFLKLYADDRLIKTETAHVAADKSYTLSAKLKPGLIKYKVEFGTKSGTQEAVLRTVNNLVCGDAYIIEGQSNALATDTGEKSPPETNEWIRSYGRPEGEAKSRTENLWCYPVWKAQKGEKAELGWWGMELAKRLVESQKIPIFIINGAVGGTRIDQHQRNDADPTDLKTIYGRMLWRAQQAKLTHGIRGILWHQGESDQGSDGPDGGYGSETYEKYFVEMSADWKEDFPNIQHYYLFQIWPNSCSMGNGHGDMLREVQRSLPRLYSHMDVISTLGIKPEGGCHYPLIGWAEFARLIQPLIERDHYGRKVTESITAPNLQRAYFSEGQGTIVLEFDQPVVWKDELAGQFYLDGEPDKVASGTLNGKVLTLKLKEASVAKKITYLKEMRWNQDKLLRGTNGIAALTFCEVPISTGNPSR